MHETTNLLFSSEDYDSAISRMVSVDHVVIYCGAGVSQALTGLSWSGLIKAMVRNLEPELVSTEESRPNKLLTKGQYEALVEYIQSPNNSPQRNASIVDEFISALSRLPAGRDHNIFLRDTMRSVLYENLIEGCRTPSLIEGICSFVVLLMESNKKVSIVTTNYDTHIEHALRARLKQDKSGKDNTRRLVSSDSRYDIFIYSNRDHFDATMCQPGQVDFHYIHGRVGKSSDAELTQPDGKPICDGNIVFSEFDYYHSQGKTVEKLEKLVGENDCIVIVGSSLDDPPLVQWIQQDREPRKSPVDQARVIVLQSIDLEPETEPRRDEAKRRDICGFKRARLEHLGVDKYLPFRSFGSIPDFFRDAVIEHSDVTASTASKNHTYRELVEWSQKVDSRLRQQKNLTKLSKMLHNDAPRIAKFINALMPEGYDIEFKTELWLRGINPHAGDPYYLVKAVDSAGPTLVPELRRVEYSARRFPSRSTALRALQFGRSELVSLLGLGLESDASRWQAFYAVPLYAEPRISHDGRSCLVVGSISLAIKLPTDIQRDRQSLALRRDFCEAIEYRRDILFASKGEQKLREVVEITGRNILSVISENDRSQDTLPIPVDG